MSWAASTLYLHDTPAARDVLLSAPALRGHTFAVDLAALAAPPRLADGSAGKLLAVRSPGRARDAGLLPDAFDWSGLHGLLAPRLAAHRPALKGDNARIAPPDAALSWMEDLAARVNGRVSWYQAESTHGDPDAELCWVIDVGGPARVRFDAEEVAFDRAPTLYARHEGRFRRMGAEGFTRDPLAMGLLHLGVRLDSPWFEPHTPAYRWTAVG